MVLQSIKSLASSDQITHFKEDGEQTNQSGSHSHGGGADDEGNAEGCTYSGAHASKVPFAVGHAAMKGETGP